MVCAFCKGWNEGDIHNYLKMRQGIPKMDRVIKIEDPEASKKSVKRTIFDPGGYLKCFNHVYYGGSTEFLNGHYMVQIVLEVEELTNKLQENNWKFYALINAPRQHLREHVSAFYEDILVHWKVGQVYLNQQEDSFEEHDPP